jgi:hypothetical protein
MKGKIFYRLHICTSCPSYFWSDSLTQGGCDGIIITAKLSESAESWVISHCVLSLSHCVLSLSRWLSHSYQNLSQVEWVSRIMSHCLLAMSFGRTIIIIIAKLSESDRESEATVSCQWAFDWAIVIRIIVRSSESAEWGAMASRQSAEFSRASEFSCQYELGKPEIDMRRATGWNVNPGFGWVKVLPWAIRII